MPLEWWSKHRDTQIHAHVFILENALADINHNQSTQKLEHTCILAAQIQWLIVTPHRTVEVVPAMISFYLVPDGKQIQWPYTTELLV